MPTQKAKILKGTELAKDIRKSLKDNIAKLKKKPGIAIILVGKDEPSHLYVRLKKKACEEVNIAIHRYLLDEDATEEDILQTIEFLNHDDDVHGIIVQLPLPKKFNEDKIIQTIDPKKDVDGFHPLNLSKMKQGKPTIIPGLALAILRLIRSADQPLVEKKAVVVSNSKIFAEPIMALLQSEKVHASYCSPKTKHYKEKISQTDIIIVAVGKSGFIKKNFVQAGAIIIDVGINRGKDGKITGDVDRKVLERKVFISPVPGGVGPMTVAMLLYNTYLLAKKDKENRG